MRNVLLLSVFLCFCGRLISEKLKRFVKRRWGETTGVGDTVNEDVEGRI